MKKYKNLLISLSVLVLYSAISNTIYYYQNHNINLNRIQDHVVLAILMIIAYLLTNISKQK